MFTPEDPRRRFVWDLIDARWPELWDQPAPLKATPELIATIAQELIEAFPTGSWKNGERNARNRALSQHRRMVRSWLDDPGLLSPHVDPVAVHRAVSFDWDTIRNLTLLERDTFVTELACMTDPWSEHDGRSGFEDVARRWWPGFFEKRGMEPTPSERRNQFLSAPPEERLALNRQVNKRRKDMREVAA
jgi:hypothetical protein